jgi:hypothetical protein
MSAGSAPMPSTPPTGCCNSIARSAREPTSPPGLNALLAFRLEAP